MYSFHMIYFYIFFRQKSDFEFIAVESNLLTVTFLSINLDLYLTRWVCFLSLQLKVGNLK